MTPGTAALEEFSCSPNTPTLHYAIGARDPIPRRLVRIPSDQQELLNRPDSWAGALKNTKHRLVNLPPKVLDDLIYAYTAHIPPPPAQKPPTSSTSIPSNSAKVASSGPIQTVEKEGEDAAHDAAEPANSAEANGSEEAGKEEDDSGDDSAVSWASSAATAERRHPGNRPSHSDKEASPEQRTPKPQSSKPSTPPVSLPQSQPDNELSLNSQNTNSDSQARQSAVFFTQAPISSLLDSRPETSSFIKSIETKSSGPPQTTPRKRPTPSFKRTQVVYPSSSVGPEEELELEIPGALADATPPINRAAARPLRASGETIITPPCGQGSVTRLTHPGTSGNLAQAAELKSSSPKATRPAKSSSTKKRTKVIRFKDSSDRDEVLVEDTPFYKPAQPKPAAPANPATRGRGPALQTSSQQSTVIPCTFPEDKPGPTALKEEETEQPGLDAIPKWPKHNRRISSVAEENQLQENAESEEGLQNEPELPPRITEVAVSPAMDVDTGTVVRPAKTSEGRDLTPEERSRFWDSPLETFCRAYTFFRGCLDDFVRACMSAQNMHKELRLPAFLYDDFIRAFCDGYIRYVEEAGDEEPLDAMEWYVENVPEPRFSRGVVTATNLERVFQVYTAAYDAARQDLAFTVSPVARWRTSARSWSGSPAANKRKSTPPTKQTEAALAPTRQEHRDVDSRAAREARIGSRRRASEMALATAIPSVEKDISPPPRGAKWRKTESPKDPPGPVSGPGPAGPRSLSDGGHQARGKSTIQSQTSRQPSAASSSRNGASPPSVIKGKSNGVTSASPIEIGVRHKDKAAHSATSRRTINGSGTASTKCKEMAAPPPPHFSKLKPAAPPCENQPKKRLLPPSFANGHGPDHHENRARAASGSISANPATAGNGAKKTVPSTLQPLGHASGSRPDRHRPGRHQRGPARAESAAPRSPAPSALTEASGVTKKKKIPSKEEYKARLVKMKAAGRLSGCFDSSGLSG